MSGNRKGDWFTTYSGTHFYPLDPRAEEVSIRDIAHALSQICRYGGHCRTFYSVGEHSCRVSRLFQNKRLELLGLLHDAAEAYIGDMVRPLKLHQPDFCRAEELVMAAIYEAQKIAPPNQNEHEWINKADNTLLVTEARDLLRDSSWTKDFSEGPLISEIHPVTSQYAEVWFLDRYQELCNA